MLESSELALDGGVDTLETFPLVAVVGDRAEWRIEPRLLVTHVSADLFEAGAARRALEVVIECSLESKSSRSAPTCVL